MYYQDLIRCSDKEEIKTEEIIKLEVKKNKLEDNKSKKSQVSSDKSINHVKNICGMNLKEKIEYFHPILWVKFGIWKTLSDCFNWIKELLLSSDGEYLFVYYIYNNYSWVYIWNLTTRIFENGWKTDSNFSEPEHKKKTLRKFMTKYPECWISTWNFSIFSRYRTNNFELP